MTQADLFGYTKPTNRDHLERVSSKIAQHIVTFCRRRVGSTFRMDELRRYVATRVRNTAPDSPSRILRSLRKKGLVSYRVESRKNSLYRVFAVKLTDNET